MMTLFKFFSYMLAWTVVFVLLTVGLVVWLVPKWGPRIAGEFLAKKTGFHLKVEEMSWSPFKGVVTLDGVVMTNSKEFQNEGFVDFERLHLSLELGSTLKDTLVIRDAQVSLRSLTLVKNEKKEMNAQVLGARLQEAFGGGGKEKETVGKKEEEGKKGGKKVYIEHLGIKIGELNMVGYSNPIDKVKNYKVNYNKEFNKVDSIAKLGMKLMVDFAGLGVMVLTDKVVDVVKDAPKEVLEQGEEIKKKLDEHLDKTVEGVKKATDAVKNLFDGFGK